MMQDLKNLIHGLRCYIHRNNDFRCSECPYFDDTKREGGEGCYVQIARDSLETIELLNKELEALKGEQPDTATLLREQKELVRRLEADNKRLDRENQLLVEKMAEAPQVIRCKDCKHSTMTSDGFCKRCDALGDAFGDDEFYFGKDYFCAMAELRED